MKLEDKVVLLTGGSRGIGPHIARSLAAKGARIALVARSAEGLNAVVSELGDSVAQAFPADLSDRAALREMHHSVESAFGPIDVLVNNAGLEYFSNFHELSAEDIADLADVNTLAPMLLSRFCIPSMLERGEGHIVNMASAAGLAGVGWGAPYGATKAALFAFTTGIRMEYRSRGVSASTIVPGFVRGAGMFEQQQAETDGHPVSKLMGSTTCEAVAAGVVRAIERDIHELVINSMPLRPAVALGKLFPGLGLRALESFSGEYMRAIAEARSTTKG